MTEFDTIQKVGHSLIQHGKYNDRIYVMKLAGEDLPDVLDQFEELSGRNNYSKIFAKIPARYRDQFVEHGYCTEAEVPGFFHGNGAACFMSRFIDPQRSVDESRETHEDVLKASKRRSPLGAQPKLPAAFTARPCTRNDIGQMAQVYAEVFPTYPFPISDPAYLLETMESHVAYWGVWKDDKLVALSSAEMDPKAQNAEMTDFATLPDYRGHGLAVWLLWEMEKDMPRRGIKLAYTIARACSYGMNITFAKMGYSYGGRLVNNTNISGNMESMNVWYKTIL